MRRVIARRLDNQEQGRNREWGGQEGERQKEEGGEE